MQLVKCYTHRAPVNTGKQQQPEHPQASHIKRFGEQLEMKYLTGMPKTAGSADLHKRISALGSMAIGFGLILCPL